MRECMVVLALGVGGDAIARDDQLIAAHVGVIGGEEHAYVGRHAGEDQRLGAEMLEQDLQLSGKKPECFGLRTK